MNNDEHHRNDVSASSAVVDICGCDTRSAHPLAKAISRCAFHRIAEKAAGTKGAIGMKTMVGSSKVLAGLGKTVFGAGAAKTLLAGTALSGVGVVCPVLLIGVMGVAVAGICTYARSRQIPNATLVRTTEVVETS